MDRPTQLEVFENARPYLLGLAYRILGSAADAEDAVQDTFIRWMKSEKPAIENPKSWLTTICTRRCIDMLRAHSRSRVDYIGTWLPEPVYSEAVDNPESKLEVASSLKTAFLLLLERLTPKERAAFLLHEIFEVPYKEVADALNMQEAACRKLVSRAKANISLAKTRHVTPIERQEKLLDAFQDAITTGATDRIKSLLSNEVELSADGGGKVPAIMKTLHGREDVMTFLTENLNKYWAGHVWIRADINGARGVILKSGPVAQAVVSFSYNEDNKVADIFIVRNPEKLATIGAIAIQ